MSARGGRSGLWQWPKNTIPEILICLLCMICFIQLQLEFISQKGASCVNITFMKNENNVGIVPFCKVTEFFQLRGDRNSVINAVLVVNAEGLCEKQSFWFFKNSGFAASLSFGFGFVLRFVMHLCLKMYLKHCCKFALFSDRPQSLSPLIELHQSRICVGEMTVHGDVDSQKYKS